ncbi:unnamed protein product [Closterium sp. NIES-65]|nr:unnamed protein product [Closterium sp. NIES-65]
MSMMAWQGLVTGGVVLLVRKGKSSLVLRFDEDLFFIYLLPPIIFNAGFQVKKKQFFRNFGAIMAYGIVGVFISFGVISAGCRSLFDLLGLPPQHSRVYLALGVIFSATDSVCTLQVLDQGEEPLVYSLVFGEGKHCTLHRVLDQGEQPLVYSLVFGEGKVLDQGEQPLVYSLVFGEGKVLDQGEQPLVYSPVFGEGKVLDQGEQPLVYSLVFGEGKVLDQGEQPLVYSLVFGEGVVNDATSIVLFRAVQKLQHDALDLPAVAGIASDFLYLFTASTALGIAFGLASAFIIRKLYFVGHATDREVALMALMAYLSYVLSEVLELSGILSVFFAGIVMSHYTWHNVTESSRVTTKHAFATMSFIAETFIFIYVGMDALDVDKWNSVNHRNAGVLFGILLSLVLLGRAAFVFPLSFLLNLQRKNSRVLLPQHQVVIWWAGLIRGAVSIALTYSAVSFSSLSSLPFPPIPSPALPVPVQFPDYADPVVATTIAATIALVLFSTVVSASPIVTSISLSHLHLPYQFSEGPFKIFQWMLSIGTFRMLQESTLSTLLPTALVSPSLCLPLMYSPSNLSHLAPPTGLRVSLTDRLLAEGGEVRGVEEYVEEERMVSGGLLGDVLRFGGEWEAQGDDARRSSSGWWSISEEGGEKESAGEQGGRKEEEGDAIEGEDLADCDSAWPARLQSPRPHASPPFHSRPSPDRGT